MMQGALTSLDTIPNLYLPFGLPNKIFAITSPSQFSEIVENDNKIIDIDYNFNDFDYIIKYFLNTGDFSTDDESKVFMFSNELKNALRQYTPIKDIKVDDSKFLINIKENKTNYQNIYINFLVENQWLEWDDLSDGTKRIFYIVSLIIIECEIGDIVPIFIEEPELGIHPDQLSDLMDFLQAQAKTKQIIITTHSPEVMNILNKDELDRIIVTRFDKEKGTQMHKLSPHKIKKGQIYMKKVGHLSDFWVHSNLEEIDEED